MSDEMRRLLMIAEAVAEWSPTGRELDVFMYGGCAALAAAIHKLTGLPMMAFIEPEGETDKAVHVVVRLNDGRYLDVNGAHTYDEVLAICRDEHECDTDQWSLVQASPTFLKLCVKDGIFDPITPDLAAEARQVAVRLVRAYGLLP